MIKIWSTDTQVIKIWSNDTVDKNRKPRIEIWFDDGNKR